MEELMPANLPDGFCGLLKEQIHEKEASIGHLVRYISKNEGLKQLIRLSFRELGRNQSLNDFIRSLGWKNFRNRLASALLFRRVNGEYPRAISLELVDDLVAIEEDYANFTVDGSSRLFLLCFYWKFMKMNTMNGPGVASFKMVPPWPTDIRSILQEFRIKSFEIDLVILLLWHFHANMGMRNLSCFLHEKKGLYEGLYLQMIPTEREKLVGNLLTYGYSINEKGLFCDLAI